MGRPRKISDDELAAACARAIGQHGPAFTLAQVAAEAGVAVGTVAGRFGSKHGLLAALLAAAVADVEPRMRAAAAAESDPVLAVAAAALVSTEGVEDPATATNHLAQLGVELADPELRAGLLALRVGVHRELTRLLRAADLPAAPAPPQAARIIAALVHGATQDWALAPETDLRRQVRQDVLTLLAGWRQPR